MPFLCSMDIARPEFKERKRRRQIIMVAVIVVAVVAVSAFVYRLKPAAPSVERGTVWTDTVKRGSMLRQVRGIGTLVPSQESVLQIPAETEATVVRIRVLPGTVVKPDTIILDMSNSQVEQAAVDAHLQWKAAEAEFQSQRMKLESDLMNQKAGAATVKADYAQAKMQSDTDKALYELGVISGMAYKNSKGKADEFTIRNDLEDQRLASNQKAIDAQLAEQQAKVDQMRALGRVEAEAARCPESPRGNRRRSGGYAAACRTARRAGNHARQSRSAESSDGRTERLPRPRRGTSRSANRRPWIHITV